MKKKIALLMAAVMLFGATVGGTLAWLQDQTNEVVNTFTVGDINITLDETENAVDEEGNPIWQLKLIPGTTETKDPVVTVLPESEACWLFVKMVEENNTINGKKIVEYTFNTTGWTPLDGVAGIYWREINADLALSGTSFELINENRVTVNDELTKADFTAIGNDTPTITFQAWAVQKDNVTTPAAAWAIANP